ncbi:MAG: PKD domain-containing protein [Candidatus Thermoplasmatota archaeon]|nr:PKD domain-containing protein [Candidatus Thermoplasmatota archaeon]
MNKTKSYAKKDMRKFKCSCGGIVFLLLMAGIAPLLQANTSGKIQECDANEFIAVNNAAVIRFYQRSIQSQNNVRMFQNEEWNKTFGRTNIDVGYCVKQTADAGYIISGYTRSYGASGHNVWLIKTDYYGNEQWNKTFGGSLDDEGQSVQQTSDNGYIITGWTKSYGSGMQDLWLIKTDSSGNEQWNKVFGGTNDDAGTSVQQTTDGGYIIAGYTSSFSVGSVDAWLIKTDSSGNQQWSQPLGGLSSDGAWCVQQTTDGGYILTGWTYSSGPGALGNVLLLKTDSAGSQQWSKAFGGTDVDRGYFVQQTTDGGYIITGYTDSYGAGLYDVLLIKTDSSGNEQWTKTFGGTGRDYGNCVDQTLDGGYIIAGYTLSYGAGGDDVWVIKTDAAGVKEWDETYGGASSDVAYSLQQTTDTGYIITGHTLSYGAGVHDVWLIKIEGTGAPPLEVDAGGPYNGFVGESISFIGTVTGGAPPYIYHWDFGDNMTSTEQSPAHIYTEEGIYEATFSVVDFLGTEGNDTTLVTILIKDTTPPEVTIIKPVEKSLYLGNKRVLSFPATLVIGSIDVTVNASDNDSEITSVRFFLNGISKHTTTTYPYVWTWSARTFGRYIIKVEAVDSEENYGTDEIVVWKFF